MSNTEGKHTAEQLIKFLDGEAPFDGVWFGDLHPEHGGKAFWWRHHMNLLADLLKRVQLLSEENQKLEARIQKLEGNTDDDDDYNDDDGETYDEQEEREYEEDCDRAASCTCGAWVFNNKGAPIHVADCICGAE
jgi:hypothetical protein